MEIRRISGQSRQTLREFYDPASAPEWMAEAARLMQALLDHLDAADHPPVWAFTSLWDLLLTDKDDWQQWLVTIRVECQSWMERPRIRVTCALGDPWYSAHGYTEEPAEAARLVIDGLHRAHRGKLRNVTFE